MDSKIDSAPVRESGGLFSVLRFRQPLEAEFRKHYTLRSLSIVRIGVMLALLWVALSSVLDWQLLAAEHANITLAVRLGIMLPALILLWSATYPGTLARYLGELAQLSAAALSAGCLLLLFFAAHWNISSAVLGVEIVSLFIYLMLGLRLVPGLMFALPLAAAFMWAQGQAGLNAVDVAYASVYILLTNVIGSLGCYRLEHAARTAFLEREVANILSGTDSVTGIPSRSRFDHHLQTIRRQSERESEAVAILLAEIENFTEYSKAYGDRAAEQALRRVAQTILNTARRPLDFAARFSGTEFVVALYAPDERHLHTYMSQLRDRVVALNIPKDGPLASTCLALTIGGALSRAGGRHDPEVLLELASLALRQAKSDEHDGIALLAAAPTAAKDGVSYGPWSATGRA